MLIVGHVNAGVAAARQNGIRFGRPITDLVVIADNLAIAQGARAKGRAAEEAAASWAGAVQRVPPPASPLRPTKPHGVGASERL